MKPIKAAIEELRSAVLYMALCNALVDSFVIFLICFLVSLLFLIPWYYAFIPFVIYSIFHSRSMIRTARYEYIERRLPFLKEQLTTVADNLHLENSVIDELNVEVLRKLREVKTSVFLKFGKLSGRIATMVILSFLIIFVSALHVKLVDLPSAVKEVAKKVRQPTDFELATGLSYNESFENIYGNKSIAELGYQEIQLIIAPLQNDLDLSKVKDPEKKEFKSEFAPKEIKAEADVSYEENIPKNYHKIVKTYFTGIAK